MPLAKGLGQGLTLGAPSLNTHQIHLLNACAVDPLIGQNLESGAPQPVACGFWRAVLAALRLTPAQVEDFCAVHELYNQHIAP
jgi:hypothetical protein